MAGFTLYWHDYETFGINPRVDRAAQFAGVRTDFDLNIIGDPLVVYCQPPPDYLPEPEACLLTGITPQLAESKGVTEARFCQLIHEQLSQPNTCSLGYNSIRFDDEFTRNCLYRNFYDPYAREWQNGNSRWDLIDVVRAAMALRPDGITWPIGKEGHPTFKLEELTKANGIEHGNAHDALADVYATIAVAKLIKNIQPKLYRFLWQHKMKAEVNKLLQLGSYNPVLHVSGRFSAQKNCLAVVLPLCRHPGNQNGIIVYDLSADPEDLLTLNAVEIKQRVFTAVDDLPEGQERVALKTIHSNKSPVLAPVNVLRKSDQQRLGIDLSACYQNIDKIKRVAGLADKICEVFTTDFNHDKQAHDPELMLYSGGFFPDRDRHKLNPIKSMTAEQLKRFSPEFIDSRLEEMLFRYKARNYPESLNSAETRKWLEFCEAKLTGTLQCTNVGLSLDTYLAAVDKLSTQPGNDLNLLNQLKEYAITLKQKYLG